MHRPSIFLELLFHTILSSLPPSLSDQTTEVDPNKYQPSVRRIFGAQKIQFLKFQVIVPSSRAPRFIINCHKFQVIVPCSRVPRYIINFLRFQVLVPSSQALRYIINFLKFQVIVLSSSSRAPHSSRHNWVVTDTANGCYSQESPSNSPHSSSSSSSSYVSSTSRASLFGFMILDV